MSPKKTSRSADDAERIGRSVMGWGVDRRRRTLTGAVHAVGLGTLARQHTESGAGATWLARERGSTCLCGHLVADAGSPREYRHRARPGDSGGGTAGWHAGAAARHGARR